MGINVAPQYIKGKIPGQQPHAEENMAMFLYSMQATAVRWSKAVVGAGGSYVCDTCQSLISLVGGRIESSP
jgi:hypothetical protein